MNRDATAMETLHRALEGNEPVSLRTLGNLDLLRMEKLGLFCSTRCPGSVILQAFDLAQALRESGRVVVGGFHTPMERECLELLLRGPAPLVVCPARAIERFRLPAAWRPALDGNRLLVLSTFEAKKRRVTVELAERRNAFVAALADDVLVAYAAPGSRTEALAKRVVAAGRPLLTLDAPENANLFDLGARAVAPAALRAEARLVPPPLFGKKS